MAGCGYREVFSGAAERHRGVLSAIGDVLTLLEMNAIT